MKDNFSPEGRLKGQHLRWHVGRGIQKPGCQFCVAAGGPPEQPEPLTEPMLTTFPPETLEFEVQSEPLMMDDVTSSLRIPAGSLSQAKRQHWRDSAWQFASTGLDAPTAAKLLGCSLEFFTDEIQALFHMTWMELCDLAMIQVLSDLQASCIRQAKKGDFKGAILLQQQGLLPVFEYARSRKKGENDLRGLSDEELRNRMLKVLDKRGWLPVGPVGDKLEVCEATPEELENPTFGAVSESGTSDDVVKSGPVSSPGLEARAGYSGLGTLAGTPTAVSPSPSDTQSPEGNGSPSNLSNSRIPPSELLRLQAAKGPVVMTPESGLPKGHEAWGLDSESSERRFARRQRIGG